MGKAALALDQDIAVLSGGPSGVDPQQAEIGRLLPGTNINAETFLATDYLNHFHEAVMLIEMSPAMPGCFDDVRGWRPLSYSQHFRNSHFRDRDLAIAAYAHVPAETLARFEDTVGEIDKTLMAGIEELSAMIELGDDIGLDHLATELSRYLRHLVDQAGAIVNGTDNFPTACTASSIQAAIDALLD